MTWRKQTTFTTSPGVESMRRAQAEPQGRRKEDPLASEERPPEGRREEHSPLDKLIDKAQGKRRGVKSPDAIDKAIDKAQESGLTEKLAREARERFSGRSGRKR